MLNQLSLSARTPGVFLASGVTVLYLFRQRGTLDVSALMPGMMPHFVPLALLSIPTLVMATHITQAFGFETIRFLRGIGTAGVQPCCLRDC